MTESRFIDPEDEAFNDIERMSRTRKESVRASMLKPKTAEEFYSELMDRARDEVRGEIDYLKRNLELAIGLLEDNQHLIADNERHVYVMLYNDILENIKQPFTKR
jgi:hypothetical protein